MKRWTPERIKALRDRHDLSQAEFVRLLPISVDTLQHWEQGRGPVPPLGEWALDRIEIDLATSREAVPA